jgi:hypothetical protein
VFYDSICVDCTVGFALVPNSCKEMLSVILVNCFIPAFSENLENEVHALPRTVYLQ